MHWREYLEREDQQTWMLLQQGTPAGYFELDRQADDVELKYLGLLELFLGRKLGDPLLTSAIEKAWDMDAKRVWVHTCSLDHPHALRNYLSRGFKIYNVTSGE